MKHSLETGIPIATERAPDFRALVGQVADQFPTKDLGGEPTNVLDAIEKENVEAYAEGLNADLQGTLRSLIALHDELKKGEPDRAFVERTVAELR